MTPFMWDVCLLPSLCVWGGGGGGESVHHNSVFSHSVSDFLVTLDSCPWALWSHYVSCLKQSIIYCQETVMDFKIISLLCRKPNLWALASGRRSSHKCRNSCHQNVFGSHSPLGSIFSSHISWKSVRIHIFLTRKAFSWFQKSVLCFLFINCKDDCQWI